MMNGKYRLESLHFMTFRSLVNDLPIGEIWHEDSPDFLVHGANGIIGVEHCLVQIPTRQRMPLQAVECQTDEIVAIAQEHVELRGTPPVQATFHFGHFSHMGKKERIDLARSIARLVYDKIMELDLLEPLTSTELQYQELPPPLSSIRIIVLEKDSEHFWRCARAGWGMEDCIELFQQTISDKDALIKRYREKCDKCWLLMVAESKPSGFIHPNQKSVDHVFNSAFESIYFLNIMLRKLYVLKTIAV